MRTSHHLLATSAVVVCAVVTGLVIDRNHRDADVRDLRKKVAALSESAASAAERDPSEPARVVLPFAPAAGQPVAAAPPPIASASSAPAEARPPAPAPAEIRDNFEIAFEDDHADPSWSAPAARQAHDKITAVLPEGSQLRSIDCRESMCRIETSHASMARYQAFARAAFMDPSTEVWNAGTFSTPLNDGPVNGGPIVIVSYVGREGKALPNVM
ncbi:MAG: hypothetical protein ACLQVI_14220 [Polyangiaceae bacterium]